MLVTLGGQIVKDNMWKEVFIERFLSFDWRKLVQELTTKGILKLVEKKTTTVREKTNKQKKKTGKMKKQSIVRLFSIKVTDSKTWTRRKISGEYFSFFSNVNFCSSLTFFPWNKSEFCLSFSIYACINFGDSFICFIFPY